MHTFVELEEEVRQLREEQERLKESQQKPEEHAERSKSRPNREKPRKRRTASPEPSAGQPHFSNYVRTHPGTILIGAVALVVLVVGATLLLNYLNSYESTDDAEVDGHLNIIAPRVAGTITGVYVEDNQFVKAGEVLVDLDQTDYRPIAPPVAGGAYGGAGPVQRGQSQCADHANQQRLDHFIEPS